MALTDKEFEQKYRKEIEGIAKYNDKDLSTAKEMFKTNLRTNSGIYKGGGVAENWSEMISDYNNIKAEPKKSDKKNTTTNSKGQVIDLQNGELVGNGSVSQGNISIGAGLNDDTVGTIIGIGVLYMFLNIFRR